MAQAHKEIEKLRLQVKKLAQKDKGSQEAASQEDEEDPEVLEKSKLSDELRVARKKLARFRDFPADEADDGVKQCIVDLETQIQGLQEKVRAGQPFDQRKAGIERQLKNAKESLKKEQHTVVMQDKSLAEVQEKRDRAAGLVLSHETAIASLEADLKEVHAKAAGVAPSRVE
jgi:DNA repair ATPase RecN